MLSGKVAIITGASKGIGAAVARALFTQGASLALCARSSCSDLATELDPSAQRTFSQQVDISDPTAVDTFIQSTVQKFGRVDIVVNNAAVIEPIADIAEADVKLWSRCMDVGVNGAFYVTHYALPYLVRGGGGVVVNISSGAAVNAMRGVSAYCASKAVCFTSYSSSVRST
eukprot:TRINITY_DN4121_c0_g1_i2.p1 TRINITY_DN4121_c0_g1~~TRINITY_DN4121_c0_g1_i2.p1  ORF type:complete len:171 (-),score=37.66 TRINITY_DN4121_c0_g1_i2:243-755(-)